MFSTQVTTHSSVKNFCFPSDHTFPSRTVSKRNYSTRRWTYQFEPLKHAHDKSLTFDTEQGRIFYRTYLLVNNSFVANDWLYLMYTRRIYNDQSIILLFTIIQIKLHRQYTWYLWFQFVYVWCSYLMVADYTHKRWIPVL